MSLTVNANATTSITPIKEGTYLAVCNMLIDLGVQYNETYKNSSRKVLVGWELPEETIVVDGEEKPRMLSKQYTASLSDKANLRQDLISWRSRDFTPDELKAFDLKNIVGKSCLITVIHRESNGKTYANISTIAALPKGMPKGKLSEPATVFDLDTCKLEDIDNLPKWIADIVRKSQTYEERMAEPAAIEEYVEEMKDEEGLPF